ncbi:MAG: enoyl-CoA hydratase/isomerase family protein [Desulfobacterales bacterium]|nr:MAG: enoyl-CoA hydratase/isomerase family protein [Desulfobacterales bacterium]
MSSEHLLFEIKDKIATAILNRPKVMNAMSKEMMGQLYDVFMQLRSDEETRVVVIKGAGEHFCSGADVNLFSENISSPDWLNGMKRVGQIVQAVRAVPQAVITMLRGVAVGGGANLALASDFVVAADNARFCEIFVNIGLIMDYGGHYFLPRLVGMARAKELALLGNEIDGKTAASIGLVYKSVPEEKLEQEVQALAASLVQKPRLAVALIKEGLEKSFDRSLKEVLDWEAAHQSITLQTPEHKEIIKLFFESKKKK